MPNHVNHVLTARGPQGVLDEMIKQVCTTEQKETDGRTVTITGIDFNKILPMPDWIAHDALSGDYKHSHPGRNWYDWNILNWGTKWGAYCCSSPKQLKDEKLGVPGIEFRFQTAWSPPTPVIRALTLLFPECYFTLEYVCEHGEYAGVETFSAKVEDSYGQNRPEGVKIIKRDIECTKGNPDYEATYLKVYGETIKEVEAGWEIEEEVE